jgi:hypothetical protein
MRPRLGLSKQVGITLGGTWQILKKTFKSINNGTFLKKAFKRKRRSTFIQCDLRFTLLD